MPGRDHVKLNSNWVMIRRTPTTFILISALAFGLWAILDVMTSAPKEWRGTILPKLNEMSLEQDKAVSYSIRRCDEVADALDHAFKFKFSDSYVTPRKIRIRKYKNDI